MMEKRYNPREIEKKCLSYWENKNIFNYKGPKDSGNFCIMMPPPNITGSLHMGHALTFTLQDILIRFKKKLGKNVLWQPGIDHAGIATEIIVEKKLLSEGKLKKKIGRENFIKEIWKWKQNSGSEIINQLKVLGTSIDWKRSRFTMDEGLSEAVNKVFVSLYDKGIIYKDKRLVNWDPKLQTAISDLEVNQREIRGNLWYINYQVIGQKNNIQIATTRPETIFGDTAIAIHPKNSKLRKYIGEFAVVPFCKRKIPIIADEYADPEKGSGAVKITPAHDFNDFLVGKRNDLEVINIFDKFAKLNENVPKEFRGLDRFIARKKVLSKLTKLSLIVKKVENLMIIPIGDRSGEIIEPLLTDQWFCDAKKLSNPIKKFVKESKINFYPSNWINSFNYWIKNIEPWCISRQIWWGHRIPAWYSECGSIFVAKNFDEANKKAKNFFKNKKYNLSQDSDVLDTWFSSALWPFSTLGWPKKTEELKKFYPTDVLITGFDIIFFWVARMVMMGIHFMKNVPFKSVYIHPLVRDEKGNKMSKSKGNVINPLDIIKENGADALRFTLIILSTQGRDIKLSDKLIQNNRNFITKIWNLSRFFELNNFKYEGTFNPYKNKLLINNWIFFNYCKTQEKVSDCLEKFQFSSAANLLYQFIWHDLCDLYVELIKPYIKNELNTEISYNFGWILKNSLNLINPFIPFVSEEISLRLDFIKSYDLFSNSLPKLDEQKIRKLKPKVLLFENIIDFIKDFRKFIKLNSISQNNVKDLYFSKNNFEFLKEHKIIIESFFNIKRFLFFDSKKSQRIKVFVSSGMKFGILIDEENNSIDEKIGFFKKEIIYFTNKLSNEKFIKNAPKEIVAIQKKKLKSARKNLELLENNSSKKNV